MLALLLINIFFAAVINVTCTRFKTDKDIMDALVHLRKKTGPGGRVESYVREPALETSLWGVLFGDDAGVVLQSPKQLRKMMGVIVVVCTTFGLTELEAKTKIMCLRTEGVPGSTVIPSVGLVGQVYTTKQTCSYTSGGMSYKMPTCSSRSTDAYATHDAAAGSTPSICTTD